MNDSRNTPTDSQSDSAPSAESGAGRYHHGNLKEALINTFLQLLETEGIEKISMRKLATLIGVAPTAVYNHFGSKDELQVAVKTKCLNHFADYLDASEAKVSNPKQGITEIGKAYFNYSQIHKQYFHLIMSTPVPDELVTDELLGAGMRAEASIRNTVVALLEQHGLPSSQYNEGLGAFACWSVAHGISTLAETKVNRVACVSGRWPPEFEMSTPDQVHQSFDVMTDVLVAGILAAAKKEP